MSRSYKKNPFFTWTKSKRESDKQDKNLANRSFRRITRKLLDDYNEYTVLPLRLKEVSDVWGWNSDGPKHYRLDVEPKDMRK